MKILSFSVFGDKDKYINGLLKNIALRQEFYPDWTIFVYCDQRNHEILAKNPSEKTVLRLVQTESHGAQGTCWRFLASSEEDVKIILFRDADSIFTKREILAVNEWLASPFDAHLMRDHPLHSSPIMAGMFGLRGNGIALLSNFMKSNYDSNLAKRFGYDQDFLNFYLYPKIKRASLVHTDFIGYLSENIQPFKKTDEYTFVGAYAHAHVNEHRELMRQRDIFRPVTLLPFEWHVNPYLSWIQQRIKLPGIWRRN